jgi:hypothetical protein
MMMMTAFTFVIEHLVMAILGRRTWKRHMCAELVSTSFTPSDEAFLYVILSNSYPVEEFLREQDRDGKTNQGQYEQEVT